MCLNPAALGLEVSEHCKGPRPAGRWRSIIALASEPIVHCSFSRWGLNASPYELEQTVTIREARKQSFEL